MTRNEFVWASLYPDTVPDVYKIMSRKKCHAMLAKNHLRTVINDIKRSSKAAVFQVMHDPI